MGKRFEDEWSEEERLEIEAEQEMILKAEIENWRIANNFDEEED